MLSMTVSGTAFTLMTEGSADTAEELIALSNGSNPQKNSLLSNLPIYHLGQFFFKNYQSQVSS